jgi:hypothetical protein
VSEDEEETIVITITPRPLVYEATPPVPQPLPTVQKPMAHPAFGGVSSGRRLSVPSTGAISPSSSPARATTVTTAPIAFAPPPSRARPRESCPVPQLATPQKDAALRASPMRSPSPVFAPPPTQGLFALPPEATNRQKRPAIPRPPPPGYQPGAPFEVPTENAASREIAELKTNLTAVMNERTEMRGQIQDLKLQVDTQQAMIAALCKRLGIQPHELLQ